MNIQKLEQLFKRVNLEDDLQVKHHMLVVAEKFLELQISGSVRVDNIQSFEEVEENNAPTEHQVEEIAEEVISEQIVLPDTEEQVVLELEPQKTPVEAPGEPEKAEPILSDNEEDQAPVCIEKFSLLSPTKEKQLAEMKEKGAILFRETNLYMLGLSIEDEVIAFAKTPALKTFPKEIHEHLKNGGFVSANVVVVSDIEKKRKIRYVDVTFADFVKISDDDPIAQNIKNLLEKGKAPEPEEKPAEIIEKPAESKNIAEELSVNNLFTENFMINPRYVQNFQEKKEAVLQPTYQILVAGKIAKLTLTNNGQTLTIALNEQSSLKEGSMDVHLVDYILHPKDAENRTFGEFTLRAKQDESIQPPDRSEKKQSDKPAPSNETPANNRNMSVKVLSNGEVPVDFPLTNHLQLYLYPYAETMLTPETVKDMIGQPLDLGFITRPNEQPHIGLMYDVFEMAKSANTLTQQPMRNSKWMIQVKEIELKADGTGRKYIDVTFDYLAEYPQFSFEKPEDALDILKFIPITEENYNKRAMGSSVTEIGKPESPPATISDKKYDQEATKLLEPKVEGVYSGAAEEIRNQPIVTQNHVSNQAIAATIVKTQAETSIHLESEQKEINVSVENPETLMVSIATHFTPDSWSRSIGKTVRIISENYVVNGIVQGKVIKLVGKENRIVGQGYVFPNGHSLLNHGDHYSAILLGIQEGKPNETGGFVIPMTFGEFQK